MLYPRPPLWSSGRCFWLQVQRSQVRFPALPDFLVSSGSGTGSTRAHGSRNVKNMPQSGGTPEYTWHTCPCSLSSSQASPPPPNIRAASSQPVYPQRQFYSDKMFWIGMVKWHNRHVVCSAPLFNHIKKLNSMVWVRERTIPTERPPLVDEVIANFCG
jgi:hypothetical protein